ncbi:MAG: ribose-phosphate pyrophosphokinase [Eubacteriales bacterium]|nr:ribose-phosphate pyrophosphokinase [Eubacteriales bacterium]
MKFRHFKFGESKDNQYYTYDQYGDNSMFAIGPAGLIGLPGAETFTSQVNDKLIIRRQEYLNNWEPDELTPGFLRDDYRIPVDLVRFSSGEGKAVINSTVRGHDLYLIVDPMNYNVTYKMFGFDNHTSPDDHYQNLVRTILAISGKAQRINVIMPFLYEGRQHRRSARESLDCAYMLEELISLGVINFITFDAHDERVSNSVPLSGFESIPTAYQILKAIVRTVPDLDFSPDKLMVVSPDEGAINRAVYYASMLGLKLGTFYKRRDYSVIEGGRNPIVAHEFLGTSVEGYDILIVDDMIASGDSMLDLAINLKARGARRIFCVASFGLFTDGPERFNKAYEDGLISHVFCTNLTYHSPEVLNVPWFAEADMTKFVALLIDSLNHNASLTSLLDPSQKIQKLLDKHKSEPAE